MRQEKAAEAVGLNGLVDKANSATAFYQASPLNTNDIAPWEHISAPLDRVIAKLSQAYAISQPLARAIAENAGLARRAA